MAQVADLIDGPEQAAELRLDIRGTDFQMRVWDALQASGQLASYRWGEHKSVLLGREAISAAKA